jgi:hypothetical protein
VTERSAALGVGTLAAAVTALPAVPRVASLGASGVLGFLALFGGTALVLGPLLVCANALGGEPRRGRSAFFGLAIAAAPLALLAEGLKRSTHHRPLGAATFAVFALATIAGSMLAAWRLLDFSASGATTVPLRGLRDVARRAVFWVTVAAALSSVGFVLVRALGAPALAPHVLDGLRALATATLCHLLLRFPQVTAPARRAGGPLWVAVVVAGLVSSRGEVAVAVRSAAPVLGGPQAWF